MDKFGDTANMKAVCHRSITQTTTQFLVASCFFAISLSTGMAGETPIGNEGWSLGNSTAASWLARTDASIYFDENVLSGEIETIQPLFMTPDFTHTFFTQGRIARDSDKWTLNAGVGYRYLLPNQKLLLGINSFFDMETRQFHKRASIGVEAIGEQLSLRANVYKGITGWNTLTSNSTTTTDTKPVNGFDISIEGPAPYMPWLRLEANYFQWLPDEAKDVHGFQGSIKAQLTHSASFKAGYVHTNNSSTAFARLTLALGTPPEHQFTAMDNFISDQAFAPRDLTLLTLAKVERNNEIVLEERTTTTGVVSSGVSISRGT